MKLNTLRCAGAANLALVLVCLIGMECNAQENKPELSQAAGKAGPRKSFATSGEDYRIGPKDVIDIQIEKAPELSSSFTVSSAGTIQMPYLGRITVRDKTTEELAEFIAEGLRGKYLKNPHVSVTIKQYTNSSFFIQGAVRNPTVYQIEGKVSILKLLTLAGGLTENHGSTAFIIREIKPSEAPEQSKSYSTQSDEQPKYELLKVNISGLLKGDFDLNVLLEPGDIINIPTTDVFFVAGDVRAPGSFPLKDGTTLRQAISLAQGTTFQAATGRTIIFREDKGRREEIRVDLGAIMEGKKGDIAIMANDVIIIPNSRLKSVGGALLNAFGMGVVYRGTTTIPVR